MDFSLIQGQWATANILKSPDMAYNRRNILLRIIKIQEIVLEAKQRGITQKWVYENMIAKEHFISYATFNNYLSINAKAQLKKLDEIQEQHKKQLTIEFE